MKNIVIVLLSLSVAGLGAYVVKSKLVPEPEPLPVHEKTTEAKPVKKEAPKPPEKKAPIEEVKTKEVAPEPVTDKAALNQLQKANVLIASLYEKNKELEKEAEPSMVKGIEQILDSPVFREMAQARMQRRIKVSHAELFRKLDLDAEQQTGLNELIMARQLTEIPNNIQWMAGKFDEAAERTVAAREEMQSQVLELLGKDALETYNYWEETKNEREALEKYNKTLGEEMLDNDSFDGLVDMMYKERTEFKDLDHISKPENFDPREMTPDRQIEIMGQVEDLHKVYVKKSASILDQDKVSSFESNLNQQRQGLKQFLQFSHGIAERTSKKEAPPSGSDSPVTILR